MEESVAGEDRVVESVGGEMPAGEGGVTKAACSRDKRAPAHEHGPTESTVEATKSPAAEATKSAAVEAAAAEAAAERHGRSHGNHCRAQHGRGETTKDSTFHDLNPPLTNSC